MQSKATSVQQYLDEIPDERKPYFNALRDTVLSNLPDGFSEEMNYGMIGYVVPLSRYPAGYRGSPESPLPFANIASQKHHIALYHMGIYANPKLLDWFVREYPKHSQLKLDMGKSCIRFKKPDRMPLTLIGELMRKMTVEDWIALYERSRRENTSRRA